MKKLFFSPPLVLAPMVGLSHSALRTTILDFGGVGLLTTEMLAAKRLPAENPQYSPYLHRTAAERPLCYQLLLHDESSIVPAVEAVHRLGADGVDLNLGCPAPRVREAGGGSRLLDNRSRLQRMVREVRRHTGLPLSAKLRLGERLDASALRDTCRMLEDEGLDILTIHARLRREGFNRTPRWDWVGRVKSWVHVPVIANGGIDSVETARKCLAASGADGLMIGRAAAVRPWIFAEVAAALYGGPPAPHAPDVPSVYLGFAAALQERFLPERRLGRLKEFTHYYARNYAFGHHLASAVQSAQTVEQALERASCFFDRNPCADRGRQRR